jgi:hypothetical protein
VGGINRYDEQSQRFAHNAFTQDQPTRFNQERISAIYFVKCCTGKSASKGEGWMSTYGAGLHFSNTKTGQLKHYTARLSDPHSLSHNTVLSLYQDSNDILWVGTAGGGLNRFDQTTEQFKHYREADGLANDNVHTIIEDNDGFLWLSTNRGLSRFNPRTERFRNFTVSDGLQSDQFNTRAAFKSADGELFFGGINGFNRFYPQIIKDDKQPPVVVLTDFLLANQSVAVKAQESQGSDFSLRKTINELDNITLNYQQNLMSFTFAALNFISPMKSQYAYQLKGWDKNWLYTNAKHRRAT